MACCTFRKLRPVGRARNAGCISITRGVTFFLDSKLLRRRRDRRGCGGIVGRGRRALPCPFGWSALLSHLLEVLLHILLEGHGHFVAIDLATGFAVRRFAVGIGCLELLL